MREAVARWLLGRGVSARHVIDACVRLPRSVRRERLPIAVLPGSHRGSRSDDDEQRGVEEFTREDKAHLACVLSDFRIVAKAVCASRAWPVDGRRWFETIFVPYNVDECVTAHSQLHPCVQRAQSVISVSAQCHWTFSLSSGPLNDCIATHWCTKCFSQARCSHTKTMARGVHLFVVQPSLQVPTVTFQSRVDRATHRCQRTFAQVLPLARRRCIHSVVPRH